MAGTQDELDVAVRRLNLLRRTIFKHLRERNDPALTERVLRVLGDAIREAANAVLPAQPQDARRPN